jgi:hypothetical protein
MATLRGGYPPNGRVEITYGGIRNLFLLFSILIFLSL